MFFYCQITLTKQLYMLIVNELLTCINATANPTTPTMCNLCTNHMWTCPEHPLKTTYQGHGSAHSSPRNFYNSYLGPSCGTANYLSYTSPRSLLHHSNETETGNCTHYAHDSPAH